MRNDFKMVAVNFLTICDCAREPMTNCETTHPPAPPRSGTTVTPFVQFTKNSRLLFRELQPLRCNQQSWFSASLPVVVAALPQWLPYLAEFHVLLFINFSKAQFALLMV